MSMKGATGRSEHLKLSTGLLSTSINFVNNATHRRRRPHRDARLVFNARFRMFNKLVAKRIYTEIYDSIS